MATRRETDPRWGEVVVKEATDEAGRARLRREAEVLGWCRNPGVVELLHHERGDGKDVLVTSFCGPRTLLDVGTLPADQVAALGAGLAQTLADLHQLGISHGNLLAEHVLLTDGGAPLLCGLADAGVVGPTTRISADQPGAALATGGISPDFDPDADADALRGLLRALLDPATAGRRRGANPVSDLLDRTPPLSVGDLADGLARQAGQRSAPLRVPASVAAGTEHTPSAAPSERAPAERAAAERGPIGRGVRPPAPDDPVPPATGHGITEPVAIGTEEELADWFFSDALIDGPTRQFGPQPPRRLLGETDGEPRRWRRVVALVGLATLALVIGAATVLALGGRPEAAPTATMGSVPVTGETTTTAAPTSSTEASPTTQDLTPRAPATPTAAAGCPTTHDDAARIGIADGCAGDAHAEGNRIVVGPLTWELGTPGDQAAVADFTCDGWLDAAALDRAGNVFVFDRWAGSGGDAPAGRLVRQVTAAQRLETRAGDAGCGVLAVVADGAEPILLDARDLA